MAKKAHKSSKKCGANVASSGLRPSVGIIITLAVALIISIVISVVSVTQLKKNSSELVSDKLALFDHLAESYIRDMDFKAEDQDVYKQITGYGVSDEDGVFYITFDFAPYPAEGTIITSMDDLDFRHGIIYFQWDAERNTYGHAFSYHDDAYHPGGIYYSLGE